MAFDFRLLANRPKFGEVDEGSRALNKLPYDNFNPREFILRDWLALDRTVLANERTFLAYSRTALTLVLAGLTFIRFFGPDIWSTIGYVCIVLGTGVWLTGLKHYLHMLGHYRALTVVEEQALREERESGALPS